MRVYTVFLLSSHLIMTVRFQHNIGQQVFFLHNMKRNIIEIENIYHICQKQSDRQA